MTPWLGGSELRLLPFVEAIQCPSAVFLFKGFGDREEASSGRRGVNSIVECVGQEEERRVRVWGHCEGNLHLRV